MADADPVMREDAYATPAVEHSVRRFLIEEAELLDSSRFRDWLACLDVGIRLPGLQAIGQDTLPVSHGREEPTGLINGAVSVAFGDAF